MVEWALILSALAASVFTLVDLGYGPLLCLMVGGAVALFVAFYGFLALFAES